MFVCTNKYYCFLKKRKKKKSTLGTRGTFCFEPIFLYWATLTKQKKKKNHTQAQINRVREKSKSPIQSIAKRNPSTCYCRKEYMTIEFVRWPTMGDNGPNQSRPSFKGPINSLSLRWSPRVFLQGNSYTQWKASMLQSCFCRNVKKQL